MFLCLYFTDSCVSPSGAAISPCSYTTLVITTGATYQNSETCIAVLTDPAGGPITLTFTAFTTQSIQDVVTVYNGGTTASPVLLSAAGSSVPAAQTSTGVCEHATTASVTVNLPVRLLLGSSTYHLSVCNYAPLYLTLNDRRTPEAHAHDTTPWWPGLPVSEPESHLRLIHSTSH
jgi:hypothetical protein